MAYPIRHSSSPAMQNEAIAYLGLDYCYICFEVDNDNLEQAIQSMKALKVRGGNVSMPNKIEVMKYLDKLTPEAKLCGAVNTIINDDGVLTGHITDGIGFVRSLEDREFDLKGKKMTIVGGGGAAKAIQIQSALAGLCEISIFNPKDGYWDRVCDTTHLLNTELNCKANLYDLADLAKLKEEIYDSDILVNGTAVGMSPQKPNTYIPDESYFKPGMLVYDVIYAPRETKFLKLARQAGCTTMNGLSMMLFQGAESFKLWTGHEMPIYHMKEYLGIESNS